MTPAADDSETGRPVSDEPLQDADRQTAKQGRALPAAGSPAFAIGNSLHAAPPLDCGLYVIATPIGNLSDVTLRALEVLAAADLLACEDTRVTRRLLDRYGIRTPMMAYNEHNDARAAPKILARLREGGSVALVSDAGTPLVSDPGQRLVEAALAEGLPVFPLPGPSAPVAALVASGFPATPFAFAGFLPPQQGKRLRAAAELAGFPGTLVFFESPNRLGASLADLVTALGGQRQAAVCREITKLHEEVRRGRLADLAQHYGANRARGEIVIVVGPGAGGESEQPDPAGVRDLLLELLETMTVSKAAAEAARLTGLARRDLYAQALELRKGGGEVD